MLFLTIDFPPKKGGVARYSEAFCRHFKHEISVIADNNCLEEETPPEPDFKLKYTNILTGKYIKWSPAVKILKNSEEDLIVVSHILPLGTAALINKLITKKPFAVMLHGMDFSLAIRNPWKRFLTKRIINSANIIITNTKSLKNEVKKFSENCNPIVVYPQPGIKARPSFSKEKTQENKITKLISVSRLVERKGIQRTLKALSELNLSDNITYTILGNDNTYRKEITNQIEKLNLSKNVILKINPTDEEIIKELESADIFILPTITTEQDREGFGIVYSEAASFEIPSIASNIPGVDEAIINNETGILVNSDKELKSAIQKLVEDKDLARKMGKTAKIRQELNFSQNIVFKEIEDAINKI